MIRHGKLTFKLEDEVMKKRKEKLNEEIFDSKTKPKKSALRGYKRSHSHESSIEEEAKEEAMKLKERRHQK